MSGSDATERPFRLPRPAQLEELSPDQVVAVVMDYLTTHAQYAAETPIDASYRALVDKWPCE